MRKRSFLTTSGFLICSVAPPCIAVAWLVASIDGANGAMSAFRHRFGSSFPEYRILAGSGVRLADALPSLGLFCLLLAMGCFAVYLIWREQNSAATMTVIGFVVLLFLFSIALTAAGAPIQQCFQHDPCPLDLQPSQSYLTWASWLILSGVVGVLTIALLNLDDSTPPPTNAHIKHCR